MNFFNKINGWRRRYMSSLTDNIGKNQINKKVDLSKVVAIKKILICRPNQRLGNLLLITPLLDDVIATFPNSEIDIIVKGNLGPIVFQNYENIKKIIILPRKPFKELIKYFGVWFSVRRKKYDLVINAVEGSSSGKLLTKTARAQFKIYGAFNDPELTEIPDYEHIAKKPVYTFRHYLSKLNFRPIQKPIPKLNLRLNEMELQQGKEKLHEIVQNNKKNIALFTYATGTKCYSKAWWQEVYNTLKNEHSEYNFVEVLPIENISQIDFKAPTFYSKDIREIGAFISNTDFFIGADSGIMHLANATNTPTIGLFSVTNTETYGSYGCGSAAINTNGLNADELVKTISDKMRVSTLEN